ncbi:MAG: metallopeptidase family protein [Pedococcus sp.]
MPLRGSATACRSGGCSPPHGRQPARIVIYRRPVEARAQDQRELTAIVGDVVVEQVAALFGLQPGDLDPRYGDGDAG